MEKGDEVVPSPARGAHLTRWHPEGHALRDSPYVLCAKGTNLRFSGPT